MLAVIFFAAGWKVLLAILAVVVVLECIAFGSMLQEDKIRREAEGEFGRKPMAPAVDALLNSSTPISAATRDALAKRKLFLSCSLEENGAKTSGCNEKLRQPSAGAAISKTISEIEP